MYERDVEEEAWKRRRGLGLVKAVVINVGNVQAYRNR